MNLTATFLLLLETETTSIAQIFIEYSLDEEEPTEKFSGNGADQFSI